MNASAFVGTSVDGFIARPNGELDFLPQGGGEPHGYNEFIATIDVIVIGRNTFETVLGFGGWPYGKTPVVVPSTRPSIFRLCQERELSRCPEARGRSSPSYRPEDFSTPTSNMESRLKGFLRAGLIQRLTITRVPVLIGEGIPLFGALPRDVNPKHAPNSALRQRLC